MCLCVFKLFKFFRFSFHNLCFEASVKFLFPFYYYQNQTTTKSIRLDWYCRIQVIFGR